MKTPKRLGLLSLFSLAGVGVSVFQTWHFFQLRNGLLGFKSFCTFGKFDCEAVESSTYSQVLGIPLSAFAAGWLFAIFVISLMARNPRLRREALRAATAMTGAALAFTVFYLFIMFSVLKAYCLLCFTVDAINLANFVLVVTLLPGNLKKDGGPTSWKPFAAVAAGGIASALLLSLLLNSDGPSSQQVHEIVMDTISSPVLPVTAPATSPSIGPENAPITIVKFSDFQCPACRRGAYSIHSVLKAFPGKIRFVFRNFPLDQSCNRAIQHPMHAVACEAARLAWCMHRQGRFEEAYMSLFDHQDTLAESDMLALFAKNDAEKKELRQCMDSPGTTHAIAADIEDAIALNVNVTPTFFINGHRVEGGLPPYVWSELINELLKHPGT